MSVEVQSAPAARAAAAPRQRALAQRDLWLAVAACVGAALPVIVSTIRGVAEGFVPNGDRGVIAIRAFDVFSSNTPLVGQFSASSLVTGDTVHSPGPMLYWLLAPAAHIGGPALLAVTMGVVNAAMIVVAVLLARRRGGNAFMVVAAVALALMTRSLAAETYHDIWNPSVGVVPIALLAFVCWSLACGDHRLLPLAVLVASFATQAELTFLLPSVALVAVGVVWLAGPRLTRAGRAAARRARPGEWRWWLAALVVAVLCWLPAIIDELGHRRGNLSLIAKTATTGVPTVGATFGWRAIVHAVGIPPWWLHVAGDPFGRTADVTHSPPILMTITAIAFIAGLIVALAAGFVRRRRDVSSAAAAGLVLLAALGAVAASTPTKPILESSIGYTLWWGSPAGMWVWLAAGWSLAALPRPRLALPRRRVAALATAGGGALALAAGAAASAAQSPDQDRSEYRPLRRAIGMVEAALPRGVHAVKVSGAPSWTSFDFQAGIAYALRRRGLRPEGTWAPKRTGAVYDLHHGYQGAIYVWDGREPRTSDRQIGTVHVAGARNGTLILSYSPHPGP